MLILGLKMLSIPQKSFHGLIILSFNFIRVINFGIIESCSDYYFKSVF